MFIFLDTETTGSGPEDRLCQIAFKSKGGKPIEELFNPGRPISIEAMVIHHITNEMVADKPNLGKVTPTKSCNGCLPIPIAFWLPIMPSLMSACSTEKTSNRRNRYLEWLSGTNLDEDLAYTVRHYLSKIGQGSAEYDISI